MSKRGGAAISREKNCGAVDVPACLSGAVAGYAWARNTIGESGGAVYRLHGKPGAPELYLKHGKHRVADDFGAEAARLRWLAEYLLRRLHAISPAACPITGALHAKLWHRGHRPGQAEPAPAPGRIVLNRREHRARPQIQ
jgi:aminoglycoside phosphotransferase